MEYEILPHTANLGIRAQGGTLEELFLNALRGMASVLAPGALAEPPRAERSVACTAADASTLLVDFLSEALSLSEVHREVYTSAAFGAFSETSLAATLRGVPVQEFARDIKAVTYHGVEVTKGEGGYEATVVYDI